MEIKYFTIRVCELKKLNIFLCRHYFCSKQTGWIDVISLQIHECQWVKKNILWQVVLFKISRNRISKVFSKFSNKFFKAKSAAYLLVFVQAIFSDRFSKFSDGFARTIVTSGAVCMKNRYRLDKHWTPLSQQCRLIDHCDLTIHLVYCKSFVGFYYATFHKI